MAPDELRLFVFLVRLVRGWSVRFHPSFFFDRVRDKFAVINAMTVDPIYLRHKHAEKAIDLRVILPSIAECCSSMIRSV